MKNCINILIGAEKLDEVDIFRAMYRCFSLKHNTTLIEETHQAKVLFDSSYLLKERVKREISDLWIIAFSSIRKEARMTFLQAKFHRKIIKRPFPCFKFSGEFFQYELLSTRPQIEDSSSFNFPENILSFTDFESIGTYGIFYRDEAGSIDMAYSIAAELCHSNIKVKKNKETRRAFFIPKLGTVSRINKHSQEELHSSLDIDDFEKAVLDLNVGAPFLSQYSILSFVTGLLYQYREDTVVADFFKLAAKFDAPVVPSNEQKGSPRILLINVDENKK